jgi:hypothetical protein
VPATATITPSHASASEGRSVTSPHPAARRDKLVA